MYIARFSYFVLPVNRQRAVDFIQREVKAAQSNQLIARLLVPLTRGQGGAALQFEVELPSLDQFDRFRERGANSDGVPARAIPTPLRRLGLGYETIRGQGRRSAVHAKSFHT
jgi:hypothetical protein